jgi:hypothetical protein
MPPTGVQDTQEVAADVLLAAENKGASLERERAERAMEIERERSERAQKVAVESAKFQSDTEHRLIDHDKHLAAINGSIRKTGEALEGVKTHLVTRDKVLDERNTKYETEQAEHWKNEGQAYSKKQITLAFVALIVTVLGSSGLADVIKAAFGG